MPEKIKTSIHTESEYITFNEGDNSYHFLFDENPSLSFIINYERSIQDVNKKVCEVLGYKKNELIGKDPLDYIHPEYRLQVTNIIDQLFNKETTEDFITGFITRSGDVKNILLSHGRLVLYKRNFAVLLSGADVTEKSRVLREFEENMELFVKFTNLLPAGIFIKDNNNKYIFRNKYLTDNFDPKEIEKVHSHIESPDLSLSNFVNIKDRNNIDHFCETTVFKFDSGEYQKYTGGLVFDVTDKIKSLKPVTESEAFFRTVFEHSSSGIMLTNTEGKITECNPAFSSMIGFSCGELQQMSVRDIIHSSDLKSELKLFGKVIKGDGDIREEFPVRFISASREIIWANVSLHPIVNDNGNPDFVLYLVNDITEQKLIKELFSVIAHDLRSHFHVLLGFSEMLADENEDLSPGETRKISKQLYDAFRNEYTLLENLLAWSKIQKQNIEIVPDAVNLSQAVDESIKQLSWLAGKKQIEIINLVDKNVNITFDANLLQSVLQNIISNAVKFSNENSSVRISYVSDGTPSVEISDEGTGLTSAEIERILNQDIYFTKPGTAREQGTGLGLFICREFIEKHGGRLFIRSKKGKGTTVGFTVKQSG